MTIQQRNYKIDNIKAILIFLVVLAHMMEISSGGKIYLIIFSFHMPAFIFVTGYYAKFNPQKILLELIIPYVLFQTLYRLFDGYFINPSEEKVTIPYVKPYWLLWYLFTIIIYYILLPLITTKHIKQRIQIIILSIVVSLLAGYDSTIGYYMSLSRTLTFLPFFIVGNYIGDSNVDFILFKKWYGKIIVLFGVIISSYYIIAARITPQMMYGCYSYEAAGFGLSQRAALLIVSFVWILALFHLIPNIRIVIFSDLGQGTFAVFLLHGFIIKWLKKEGFFVRNAQDNLIPAMALSALIVLTLGNKYFSKGFIYVIRGRLFLKKREVNNEDAVIDMEQV